MFVVVLCRSVWWWVKWDKFGRNCLDLFWIYIPASWSVDMTVKKKQRNSITRYVCRLFNQLVCTSFSHTLPFQRYWANLCLTVYLLSHHSVCAQPHMTWVANWQRNKPCFPINLHFTHFPLFLSVNFFPTFLASHWAILNKHLLSYVLPSDPHIGS